MAKCRVCGKDLGPRKRYCDRNCYNIWRRIQNGGHAFRVCECCGQEFKPRYGNEKECPECLEWMKQPEEEDQTVHRCLGCGAEVVGRYFCPACRERNRLITEIFAEAAWGTEGQVTV